MTNSQLDRLKATWPRSSTIADLDSNTRDRILEISENWAAEQDEHIKKNLEKCQYRLDDAPMLPVIVDGLNARIEHASSFLLSVEQSFIL